MAGASRITMRGHSCATPGGTGSEPLLPRPLQRSLTQLKRSVTRGFSPCAVDILVPRSGMLVADAGVAEGSAALQADSYLWVLVRRKDFDGWWPQGTGAVPVERNRGRVSITYGGPQDTG